MNDEGAERSVLDLAARVAVQWWVDRGGDRDEAWSMVLSALVAAEVSA